MSAPQLLVLSLVLLCVPRLFLLESPARREPTWPSEVDSVLRFFWWVNYFYCSLVHRLTRFNEAGLPFEGPAVLICNHTSGIDHLILQTGCRRVLGFMVAKEFSNLPVGGWFCRRLRCIPVNRDGKDLAATRAALRALEEGRVVPLFPEGRINRSSGREFWDAKPGAAFLALKADVPVIPAYIRGTPAVEGVMRAWYTPSRARLIFGPPVDLSDLRDASRGGHAQERAALTTAAERLMDAIKALRRASLAAEGIEHD